jgi:NAD-dependent SIR2 family protein deacetylase
LLVEIGTAAVRFIKDGPDIPDRLVQAHEDGDVVFFCGAGISYPAGLPGFEGLTTGLFEALVRILILQKKKPSKRTVLM